jgi:NADH-quinone oxidoreductase subunit M
VGIPILDILVFLPAGGAVAMWLFPPEREELAKSLAMVVAIAELGFALAMAVAFKGGTAGFQFISHYNWIAPVGISWQLGVDGISVFLVTVTTLLFPIAMAGPPLTGNGRQFMAWMLLLEAACVGTFMAMDLFVFFVMFEVTLVPGYFIIAGWGGIRRRYAAFKFFIYTFAGSAFLLVGILSLSFLAGRTLHHATFEIIPLARAASHIPLADQELILLAFFAAFAVKIPLVPFHTWLPDAYTEASTAGSMVLAGVLFKLGAYGILRLGIYILPRASVRLAPLLLTTAAIGITYGAIVAIMQRDFKRLVAYSSVADVGFIVLGLFAFTSQGVTGGVLEMINHTVTTGALFFLVGMLWERRRTLRIADLGGLQKPAPVLAWVFVLVIMSAIGLPGLNGFVGEFLVLVGTFITRRWWAVVAATGVILAAIYLLWSFQRIFQGPVSGANAAISDMTWREKGAILPLLLAIVFLGIYPKPVLDRITPSVSNLIAHVHAADPSYKIPAQGRSKVYAVPADQAVQGSTVLAFPVSSSAGRGRAPAAVGASPAAVGASRAAVGASPAAGGRK